MKLSIVMAYYNRLLLLEKTLQSIQASGYKDVEVIIVDDGSTGGHVISANTLKQFGLQGKVINLSNKTWHNSCIPYNIGFNNVSPDSQAVIIQNPECTHVGNICQAVKENLTEFNYLSFACYSCDSDMTNKVLSTSINKLNDAVQPFNNRMPKCDFDLAWYNHSVYRPFAYHFCSAITVENLKKLNGFDNRYASGHAYDDDDLVLRVKRMGLNIEFIDSPYVVHLEHGRYRETTGTRFDSGLVSDNKMLFHKIRNVEIGFKAENGMRELQSNVSVAP